MYNTVIFRVNTEQCEKECNAHDFIYNNNKQIKKKLQVLIVDDDINVANLLKEYIELRGHIVTIVDEGVRSITLCSDNKYDIVLLDYHLKGIDGVEVANIISDYIHEKTLLFAFTGDNSKQAINKFQINNMDGVIIKPVDIAAIDILLTNIENIVDSKKELLKYINTRNILLFKK
jgi:CheY-like chemotaxis protein